MLGISATLAEIALVKSLPKKFQNAYALAKIVKIKDICPEIKTDKLPAYRHPIMTEEIRGKKSTAGQTICSDKKATC